MEAGRFSNQAGGALAGGCGRHRGATPAIGPEDLAAVMVPREDFASGVDDGIAISPVCWSRDPAFALGLDDGTGGGFLGMDFDFGATGGCGGALVGIIAGGARDGMGVCGGRLGGVGLGKPGGLFLGTRSCGGGVWAGVPLDEAPRGLDGGACILGTSLRST